MCTVTFHSTDERLIATMNRDETLMRGPESPPAVHTAASGVQWAAPLDSDKGGTWMGLNEHGVVACLLNAYRPGETLLPDPGATNPSRGVIIPELLAQSDFARVVTYLDSDFDASPYQSFTLFVMGRNEGRCYEWLPGSGLECSAVPLPRHMRTSSGWDSDVVTAWRADRFDAWLAQGAPVVDHAPAFHFLLEEGAEDRSPLMRRPWSTTRSVTQAEVNWADGSISLRYWGDPQPGGGRPDTELSLRVEPEKVRS